ncbi:hypothetical protein TUM17576_46790 [Enterobacter hormaechei]|nr:hypothetical protein [Enterobacter hormaechei]GJL37859.1 hypothetical protein TUM17576_46790 [Enterobacter hormaechei]
MKLIDLLVQELPKRGGWPDGYDVVSTNGYGAVWAYKTKCCIAGRELYFHSTTEGHVTRDQYETALAASQKVEWDGVGLPPIGCECLTHAKPQGNEWCECKILAHTKFGGYDCAVFQTKETVSCSSAPHFRPIRSEADKKRKETIDLMDKRFKEVLAAGSTEAMAIFAAVYDTIAAGEMPGSNIE